MGEEGFIPWLKASVSDWSPKGFVQISLCDVIIEIAKTVGFLSHKTMLDLLLFLHPHVIIGING